MKTLFIIEEKKILLISIYQYILLSAVQMYKVDELTNKVFKLRKVDLQDLLK